MPVVAGLGVGAALILIFAALFVNGSANSIIFPESKDGIISLSSRLLAKDDSPDLKAETLSKMSERSIPIDDNYLSKVPILRQALAGADHRYEAYCPHDGCDRTNFVVITKSDLELIVNSVPSKEKISISSEPRFHYASNSNATYNRISMVLLYNNTY